jgi:PcaR/PcaU/PobR family beta-ketoadipate pathway transcriptional regulator
MKQDAAPPVRSRYNIEALARGLEILSLFSAERPSLSLSQIVELLQLNKSTAFRVLSTLEAMQYLEQDPATRQYRPGLKVLQLGFTAINTLEIRQIARPYLEKLSLEVGETVSLAALDGFRTIYMDRIRNQSIVGVVLGVGSSLPAHCTALGKVLLAGLSLKDLNRLLAANELKTYTPKTLKTKKSLLAELGEIRRQGYALDNEELASGLRAVAAPIRDNSTRIVAAANVTGTTLHITDERIRDEILPALIDTTGQISNVLGYMPN